MNRERRVRAAVVRERSSEHANGGERGEIKPAGGRRKIMLYCVKRRCDIVPERQANGPRRCHTHVTIRRNEPRATTMNAA